ncbi:hypothetical protein JQS43_25075 [Natronosporangium hydrolyticum]|uniref:Uncharacterized protein n=1 Tax=Natronosporangium hydrolyticum TaxID=2811111 RepID=A0A895YKR4_9ACTN|nr:hypothetical protein [Natronosporangium hydrolyticum]QSB14690.1 hypothetical protein JQS43_25075 [Natronosporangium hydrolyticum]
MSDASGPGPAPGVSEEQLREYLQQLRSAPVDQVFAEVLSGLLNAAQAKLGRRDGRLLIDVAAVAVEHARPYLSPDLLGQLDPAFQQLQVEQARAEEAVAQQPGAEPNDLAEAPGSPAGEAGPGAAAPPRPQGSPSSGLWVPGR